MPSTSGLPPGFMRLALMSSLNELNVSDLVILRESATNVPAPWTR
ncbi:hypothetical protein [Nonomuraea deserti]|nr:hypothetical protein [Nonomuraea deserti]